MANVSFSVLTISWYIVSAVTGSFIWRTSMNVIFFFITLVFMGALLNIRKMITTVNANERLKPNHTLMNVNLVTFAFESIVFLNVFVLAT